MLFEVNCPLIEWRSDITLCQRVWQFSEKYSYNPNATTAAGDTNIAAFQVFSRRFFQILKGPSLPQKERTRVILLAELPFSHRVKHYIFAKFTGRALCKAPAEHLSCLCRSEPPDSNRFSLQFLQEGINAATPGRFGSIMQVKA